MDDDIREFIEQVYPENVEISLTMFNEETCLKDATGLIKRLRDAVEYARGEFEYTYGKGHKNHKQFHFGCKLCQLEEILKGSE